MVENFSTEDSIENVEHLESVLSTPSPALIAAMKRLDGDIMILGIAGKMGVSMGELALRASREAGVSRRIFGVSRFNDATARRRLDRAGVETIACDLLDEPAVAALPTVPNLVYLAGRKFGTSDDQPLTWAINTVAPAHVACHFANSRIVAFSTGCVYPLVTPSGGGCCEEDRPAPIGEYAQSALARERVFSYYSQRNQTPLCLFRLNYAVEMRYGVLHDIARRIWRNQPVDTTVSHFNLIWQGDANAMALRALETCRVPATVLNVTGPETVSVGYAARQMAAIMGKPVSFTGESGKLAYLNNATRALRLFGYPQVTLGQLLEWTARWVMNDGVSLDKPTHFETTTGSF